MPTLSKKFTIESRQDSSIIIFFDVIIIKNAFATSKYHTIMKYSTISKSRNHNIYLKCHLVGSYTIRFNPCALEISYSHYRANRRRKKREKKHSSYKVNQNIICKRSGFCVQLLWFRMVAD